MAPPADKQGNDMTKLNNEIRDLNLDELDQVSGGLSAGAAEAAERYHLRVEVMEHKITPSEAQYLLKRWELFDAEKIFRGSF
jgi:hypothetical protein